MQNIEHYRELLLQKERELLAGIARLNQEVEEPELPDTGDLADEATGEIQKTVTLGEEAVLTDLLEQTRAALQRIKDGTYGKCVICGREIEPARLEAVPWTPYCLDDQRNVT